MTYKRRITHSTVILVFSMLFVSVRPISFKMDCNTSTLCQEAYTKAYSCINKKCVHNDVSFTDPSQLLGILTLIIVSALANAGGIGGGALIIPVYMFLFNYTVGHSVPLSKATILAGAIINIIMSLNKRHPENKNRLLIDFRVSSFIVPLILAGTMTGVLFTKLLPSIVVFTVLVLYLVYTTHKTYIKVMKLYRAETLAMEKEREEELLAKENNIEQFNVTIAEDGPRKSLGELLAPFKTQIKVCVFSYVCLLLASLLRGGKGTSSIIGLDSCSGWSWLIFFATQGICFYSGYYLYKIQVNTDEEDENKTRNIKLMELLYINSYAAGVLAGTLGLGGGLVINPVLIKLNVIPEVAAAISGFVVLFTSLSTTTQFIIAGAYELKAVIFFLIASGVGSLIGNMVVTRILARYKRPSLIVWLLFFLLLCSAVVLPLVGGIKIFNQANIFAFGQPC